MITRSADEISKMELIDLLAEYQLAALFLNSCTMIAGLQGATGEAAVVAYALGIGVNLATNDVINPTDMTGLDVYMEKIKAIARKSYEAAYLEVKDLNDKVQERAGKQPGRPS